MTTLLISEVFPPKTGGSGRWFWEIYRRMPREAFVIAAGQDPRQEEFDQTHSLQLTRVPLALRSWGVCSLAGLRGYWRAVRRLRQVIRGAGVRKIHTGRCLPEGVMALALKCWLGIPYDCYVHGEDVSTARESRELTWLVAQVLRQADSLIANSAMTRSLLLKEWNVASERIQLLNPGVDTSRFVPATRNQGFRRRLGWGERPVVLTVGRLQKRKGHDQMVAALTIIRKAIPDVLYVIIGDGEERSAIENLIAREQLGAHVQLLGELADDELLQCYQQCDLFVLPNRQVGRDIEGFGMVLLEAQACGKPVVAGASGGTAETMRIPETGRTVCCDGPNELAALLIDLLSKPAELVRMGSAGRQWVVDRFDWQSLTEQAEKTFQYARPLARSRPRPQPVGL